MNDAEYWRAQYNELAKELLSRAEQILILRQQLRKLQAELARLKGKK